MASNVTIQLFTTEDQAFFEQVNREWIELFFEMEPIDRLVLEHPEEQIIKQGGCILMAYDETTPVGTVALKYMNAGVYELTKMAVDKNHRGKHIGKALGEAAIQKAIDLGAHTIILYSSSKLKPALALYSKLGFIEVPVDGPYKRGDVKMKLSPNELKNKSSYYASTYN